MNYRMTEFTKFSEQYYSKLSKALQLVPTEKVMELAKDIETVWVTKKQLFIIGNGGSAGNAIHLANDFLYGISRTKAPRIRVHALASNSSVLTCLANDEGYESVFSEQLKTLADNNDMLLAFSGSGNSPNIIKALEWCKENQIKSHAVLGYNGGLAKNICNNPIHIPVEDMQISEDIQLVIGHMVMQWLCN